MEDDIDIEEHDVLDNPKIKSIFPDLSCVKMEIPDEEDDEEQYEDMIDDCQESSMQYPYEDSFQTTEEEEEVGEDSEETDEYGETTDGGFLYNNQIILGTKPPPDPEALYQEALHSKPIVYLEDWGPNLNHNPCFCQNCDILFPTVNALDAHKMIAHSFLVALDTPHKNTARKSTVTSKFCNHCSKMFPDDTSLIKHLYELLPINNFPTPKAEVSKPASNVKYQCQKCKRVFNSANAGKYHKLHGHPELKNVNNLIIKITPEIKTEEVKIKPKAIKIEPKIEETDPIVRKPKVIKIEKMDPVVRKPKVIKVEPKIENIDPIFLLNESKGSEKTCLVPKGTLFQCNVCHTCFLSSFSGIQHQNVCAHAVKPYPIKKCSICKRKIRLKDAKIHELQHQYGDKFKTYTIQKSIYEKVLCKCPKCEACFDELSFWAHVKKCNNEDATYCQECGVFITSARYDTHRQRHRTKKYTKKDIIINEYHQYEFIDLIKKRIDPKKIKPRPKIVSTKVVSTKVFKNRRKISNLNSDRRLIVYHCNFCGCSMHTKKNMHVTGECRKTNFYKQFCEKCGLTASAKIMQNHTLLHKTTPFSLKDVKYLDLHTGEPIEPPITPMYECNECEMQFIRRKMVRTHGCGNEKYIECKTCSKKFSLLAYRVHKNFHPPIHVSDIPSQSTSHSQTTSHLKTSQSTSHSQTTSHLKTSQSTSHSQTTSHLKTMSHPQSTSHPQTSTHPEPHNGLTELIKKYNSINNMWNVVFQCLACVVVTARYDVAVEHAQYHINNSLNKLRYSRCEICNFSFTCKDLPYHKKLHINNGSITRSSFTILMFNYEELFNDEWMDMFDGLPEGQREQIIANSAHRYTRSVKLHVRRNVSRTDAKYLCMNCKAYVQHAQITQHLQSNCKRNNVFRCKICSKVSQSKNQFLNHTAQHNNNKKFKIVTFNFDFDKEINEKLAEYEKLTKRVTAKDTVTEIEPSRRNKKSIKKYKMYKCVLCKCCVLLQHNVKRHVCVPLAHRKKCKICDQYASYRQMMKHMEAHKSRPYITKDNIAIIYFNKPENTETNSIKSQDTEIDIPKVMPQKFQKDEVEKPITAKPVKLQKYLKDIEKIANTPKLVKLQKQKDTSMTEKMDNLVANIFRCECGLHFTSMKTVQSHLDVCSPDLEIPKEHCSQCNLLFPTELLVTHLCNHHSKSMKIAVEKIKKINLVKCLKCLLLFKTSDQFIQHSDKCNFNKGQKCNDCNLIFHKICFDEHDCSVKDKTTYINKIIKKSPDICTVFACRACDINYLNYKSYDYHINVQHKLKISSITCEFCNLRFSKVSWSKHIKLHMNGGEEYRIKVLDKGTGFTEILTGKNPIDRSVKKSVVKAEKRKLEPETTVDKKIKIDSPVAKTFKDPPIVERSSRRIREMNRTVEINNESTLDDVDNINSDSISNLESQDHNDSAASDAIKYSIDVAIKNYNEKLFKCIYCNQHFLFAKSLEYHVKRYYDHSEPADNYNCDICGLDFSRKTLPRHKYVHHEKMKLNKEDFKIITKTPILLAGNFFNKIDAAIKKMELKCKDDNDFDENEVINDFDKSELEYNFDKSELEYNFDKSEFDNTFDKSELNNDIDIGTAGGNNDIETTENVTETANVIKNTNVRENSSDTNKNSETTVKNSEITNANSEISASEKTENNSELKNSVKITYYKCADCNVCFLTHSSCYNHSLNHETLDPKLYIQCKICEFQFLIESLKEHMDVHHNEDFKLENLTIEEYKPLEGEPKVDRYLAIDKVQSRLISTTTDMEVV